MNFSLWLKTVKPYNHLRLRIKEEYKIEIHRP